MAFYTMAFMGTAPFGSLMAGAIAHRFGAPAAVACSGVALMLGGLVYASRMRGLHAEARAIYVSKGLLPAPTEAERV
jgi:hypothetical protein